MLHTGARVWNTQESKGPLKQPLLGFPLPTEEGPLGMLRAGGRKVPSSYRETALHRLGERARRGGAGKCWNGAVERSKGYLGWNQFLFSHRAVRLQKLVCSTRVDLKQKLRGWRIMLEPPWSLRSDTKSNVVVSYGGTREKSPLKDTLPKLERFGRNCWCSEMRGWEAQVGSLRRGASERKCCEEQLLPPPGDYSRHLLELHCDWTLSWPEASQPASQVGGGVSRGHVGHACSIPRVFSAFPSKRPLREFQAQEQRSSCKLILALLQ